MSDSPTRRPAEAKMADNETHQINFRVSPFEHLVMREVMYALNLRERDVSQFIRMLIFAEAKRASVSLRRPLPPAAVATVAEAITDTDPVATDG